jgi:hypothetical protein
MVPRFWRKIKHRYDLTGSYCENCGNYYYPPRNLCPVCRRKSRMRKAEVQEEGTVISYSIVHEGNGMKTPYAVALIELDNGARIVSQLACEPDQIRIGMRVRKAFRKYGEDGEEGIIYYGTKFVPAE